LLADAATGVILHNESLVHHVDVVGSVTGQATTGIKAAECNAEELTALPYARVAVGASTAYADVNGNFRVPNAGSLPIGTTAGVRGRYFRVFSPSTDAPSITQTFTPMSPTAIGTDSAGSNVYVASRAAASAQASKFSRCSNGHSNGR
jgi:hypothetical protein